MKKNIFTLLLLLITTAAYSLGVTEGYRNKVYERMEIHKMNERLEPYIVRTPTKVYDIAGINIPDTVTIINKNGEISLLHFDKEMKPAEEVPVPGFPGGGGILETDPEHRFAWVRRGSGVYYLDTQTGETGHSVSMFMGSKVYQVFLANPEKKFWMIVYGQMGGNEIDAYNLVDNKKTNIAFLDGYFWRFTNGKILAYTKSLSEQYEWRFSDTELSYPDSPKEHEITKKLTALNVRIDEKNKSYNLSSRIMLGTTQKLPDLINNGSTDISIRWNEDEDEVKIEPLLPLHKPDDIGGLVFCMYEFSSDGKWFDADAVHKYNGIGKPEERFIYNVSDAYPAGISPPIRLGLIEPNTRGAFMQHSAWGPCYVMRDKEKENNVLVYKLSDGMEIIADQLRNYVPGEKK